MSSEMDNLINEADDKIKSKDGKAAMGMLRMTVAIMKNNEDLQRVSKDTTPDPKLSLHANTRRTVNAFIESYKRTVKELEAVRDECL